MLYGSSDMGVIQGHHLRSNQYLVVRVYDENDAVVFQQMAPLGGTPDPPVIVEPGVWGVRVELELSEHESNDCGGFSELQIVGI